MPSEVLSKILAQKFPQDPKNAERICGPLINAGPETVKELIGLVGDAFGDPNGVHPKYVLHGLVFYASRPAAAAERKMVAETLAGALSAGHSDELKAFIARQLQLCGRSDEVPALARLLESDRLCEPASQALQAIRGDRALSALNASLAKAEGRRKTTLQQAVQFLSERE